MTGDDRAERGGGEERGDGEAEPSPRVGPEEAVALVLFSALGGAMVLQVFTRYVLNDSLAWTEEVARYLLIAVAFVGAAAATRRAAHIAVDTRVLFRSARVRAVLGWTADLLTLGFFAWCAWLAILTGRALRFPRMTVLDVPMTVVYAVVALGLGLCALRALQRILARLAGSARP